MRFEPLAVPTLMRDYGVKPKKGLGQNFLVEEHYLEKIAATACAGIDMEVLEIGAGIGNLTRHLAAIAHRVTAIELDGQLIPILKKVTRTFNNVRIVQGDILKQPLAELMGKSGYAVAANIPYYITSKLIRYLLENPVKPDSIVLTIQREVANRICERKDRMSVLSLSVQVYGSPQIAFEIPAGAFHPVPKVDSAVLTIDLYDRPLIAEGNLDAFFRLVKAAFRQKRKMLHNALTGAPGLSKEKTAALLGEAGVDPKRRAQTLSIPEWKELTKVYKRLLEN